MSVRPPTLREERRYLLAWVEPCDLVVDGKDLYYVIYDVASSLWGDVDCDCRHAPGGHVGRKRIRILPVWKDMEREFSIALSTVTLYRETPGFLRICAIWDN